MLVLSLLIAHRATVLRSGSGNSLRNPIGYAGTQRFIGGIAGMILDTQMMNKRMLVPSQGPQPRRLLVERSRRSTEGCLPGKPRAIRQPRWSSRTLPFVVRCTESVMKRNRVGTNVWDERVSQ